MAINFRGCRGVGFAPAEAVLDIAALEAAVRRGFGASPTSRANAHRIAGCRGR